MSTKAHTRFLWADGDIVFDEPEPDQRSAAYDPSQPRVPAGHPNGGQWTDGGTDYLEEIGPQSKDFPFEDTKRWFEAEDHLDIRPPNEGPYETYDGETELNEIQQEQTDNFIDAVWPNGTPSRASEAKRDVAKLIGSHLEREFTAKELAHVAGLLGGYNGLDLATFEEEALNAEKSKIAQDVASKIVHHWAHSSGDHAPFSILMQDAVRQEFGLDDAPMDHIAEGNATRAAWGALFLQTAAEQESDPAGHRYKSDEERADRDALVVPDRRLIMRVFRAHARAQYTETQKVLEAADIDSLDLVRGAGLPNESALDIARTGDVLLQPISSFSTHYVTARNFSFTPGSGGPTAQTVIRSRVPRHRIFSFPKTGFGCLSEDEVVVLGGKMKARIMYWLK